MTGRVVIVTGADRGLGYETARYLAAEGGYDVVLACKDPDKGQVAVQNIRKENPSALVSCMQVCVNNTVTQMVVYCRRKLWIHSWYSLAYYFEYTFDLLPICCKLLNFQMF